MPAYYDMEEARWTFEELAAFFEAGSSGKPDQLNWLFLSTSGVHGSYVTLDDLEKEWGKAEHQEITMILVCPRIVHMKWGTLSIKREHIPLLREWVAASLEAVRDSQIENLPGEKR